MEILYPDSGNGEKISLNRKTAAVNMLSWFLAAVDALRRRDLIKTNMAASLFVDCVLTFANKRIDSDLSLFSPTVGH